MTPETRVKQLEAMLDRIAKAGDIADRYHAPGEECIADGVESLVEDYQAQAAELARVTKLIREHYTGPHDSLEDLVRNILQELLSNRENCRLLERQVAQLTEWQADVTVALQREGGTHFDDVPHHIKNLVAVEDKLKKLCVDYGNLLMENQALKKDSYKIGFRAALTKVADDWASRGHRGSDPFCSIEVQAFLDSRHVHYPECQEVK